jgi:hypothetical protein
MLATGFQLEPPTSTTSVESQAQAEAHTLPMDEPQIYNRLTKIFEDVFDEDSIRVTPELSAKHVDGTGGPAFELPELNHGGCPALAFCARAGTMLSAVSGLTCRVLVPWYLYKRGNCENSRGMRPWYPPLQRTQGWGTLDGGDLSKNQRVGHPL